MRLVTRQLRSKETVQVAGALGVGDQSQWNIHSTQLKESKKYNQSAVLLRFALILPYWLTGRKTPSYLLTLTGIQTKSTVQKACCRSTLPSKTKSSSSLSSSSSSSSTASSASPEHGGLHVFCAYHRGFGSVVLAPEELAHRHVDVTNRVTLRCLVSCRHETLQHLQVMTIAMTLTTYVSHPSGKLRLSFDLIH